MSLQATALKTMAACWPGKVARQVAASTSAACALCAPSNTTAAAAPATLAAGNTSKRPGQRTWVRPYWMLSKLNATPAR